MNRAAVFLDRDGVIVKDADLLTRVEQIEVLPGAAAAIRKLNERGWPAVVVTNQPVVARGLVTEAEVRALQGEIERRLRSEGARLDGFYFCPHHPRATLAAYRLACLCRKPRPGMLLEAARALELDLGASVMVGDRPTDLAAGRRAGCRVTVLIGDGAPTIESPDPPSAVEATPDHRAADLAAAVSWLFA